MGDRISSQRMTQVVLDEPDPEPHGKSNNSLLVGSYSKSYESNPPHITDLGGTSPVVRIPDQVMLLRSRIQRSIEDPQFHALCLPLPKLDPEKKENVFQFIVKKVLVNSPLGK